MAAYRPATGPETIGHEEFAAALTRSLTVCARRAGDRRGVRSPAHGPRIPPQV